MLFRSVTGDVQIRSECPEQPPLTHLKRGFLSDLLHQFRIESGSHVWFTDAADHCQRGTAQSTYFLSFESGFSVGAALVLLKSVDGCVVENVVALAVLSLSLFVYLLYTGRWLRRKKL